MVHVEVFRVHLDSTLRFGIACVLLGEVARPERFELPAFWFVVGKAGNPKALQVSHLQAAPASKLLPQLVHKLVHKSKSQPSTLWESAGMQ